MQTSREYIASHLREPTSASSLAGILGVSRQRASMLLNELISEGVVHRSDSKKPYLYLLNGMPFPDRDIDIESVTQEVRLSIISATPGYFLPFKDIFKLTELDSSKYRIAKRFVTQSDQFESIHIGKTGFARSVSSGISEAAYDVRSFIGVKRSRILELIQKRGIASGRQIGRALQCEGLPDSPVTSQLIRRLLRSRHIQIAEGVFNGAAKYRLTKAGTDALRVIWWNEGRLPIAREL